MQPVAAGVEPAGRLRGRVEAVLFDIYGTLLISRSGDIHAARRNVETAGQLDELLERFQPAVSREELLDTFFRKIESVRSAMRANGVDHPEVEIDRIWQEVLNLSDPVAARRFALEFEMIVNPCYPMPHARELFPALRKRGMFMGIISNAQFFTPLVFRELMGVSPESAGCSESLIFYSYRHGCAKPSHRLFQAAARQLQKLGTQPQHALYAGNDMRNDILPAGAEGFQTVLFAGDGRSLRTCSEDARCAGQRPDLVITDWRQLTDRLDRDMSP
jgi:putative hydrolase of the HAD superfamily